MTQHHHPHAFAAAINTALTAAGHNPTSSPHPTLQLTATPDHTLIVGDDLKGNWAQVTLPTDNEQPGTHWRHVIHITPRLKHFIHAATNSQPNMFDSQTVTIHPADNHIRFELDDHQQTALTVPAYPTDDHQFDERGEHYDDLAHDPTPNLVDASLTALKARTTYTRTLNWQTIPMHTSDRAGGIWWTTTHHAQHEHVKARIIIPLKP